jgi:hypothetical protein
LREHLIAVILVLNRVHVAQNYFPQLIEAILHLLVGLALELGSLALCLASDLVGLALELGSLALCLASDLVGLALSLTGHLVRLALGLSGGVWGGLLYGLGDFLCSGCQYAVQ